MNMITISQVKKILNRPEITDIQAEELLRVHRILAGIALDTLGIRS